MDAERVQFGRARGTSGVQKSYLKCAVPRQSAFGLLSRSRPILRIVRGVIRTENCFFAGGEGCADSPRGDTPYAPTRCPRTRMDPGEFGMT